MAVCTDFPGFFIGYMQFVLVVILPAKKSRNKDLVLDFNRLGAVDVECYKFGHG